MPRAKRRKKQTVRKAASAGRRRRGRPAAVRPSVKSPLAEAVESLTRARRELAAQRDALDQRIAALDNALSAMGAAVRLGPGPQTAVGRGRRGRRGRRAGSLKDHIARVLSSAPGPMAVKDVTAAVLNGGYKTRNRTLAKSVGIALAQMPEAVKIGRGLFRMK